MCIFQITRGKVKGGRRAKTNIENKTKVVKPNKNQIEQKNKTNLTQKDKNGDKIEETMAPQKVSTRTKKGTDNKNLINTKKPKITRLKKTINNIEL